MNRATSRRAWSLVAKWRRDSSSCSRVELKLSAAALSSAEPTRPIDWVTPSARAGLGEEVADVLAALVGVEDHAGDVAAAHRGGHAQRRLGERRVVMLAHREARQPPRREVHTVAR